MSTCCIALGELGQIRGCISKMKCYDGYSEEEVDSKTTKYVLTEAFNCIHAHVQRGRKTDRNISVCMRTD